MTPFTEQRGRVDRDTVTAEIRGRVEAQDVQELFGGVGARVASLIEFERGDDHHGESVGVEGAVGEAEEGSLFEDHAYCCE